MTDIAIPAARLKDAAAIARLSTELNEAVNDSTAYCTAENIKATLFFHYTSFHVLVAKKAGKLVGCALWHAFPFRPACARL